MKKFFRLLDGRVNAGSDEAFAFEAVFVNNGIGADQDRIGIVDIIGAEVSFDADGAVRFDLYAIAQILCGRFKVLGRHVRMRDARGASRDGEN